MNRKDLQINTSAGVPALMLDPFRSFAKSQESQRYKMGTVKPIFASFPF